MSAPSRNKVEELVEEIKKRHHPDAALGSLARIACRERLSPKYLSPSQ